MNLIQTRLPERFSSYEARTASRIATILDPRFKKDGFNSPSNAEQALEEEVYTYLSKPSPAVPPTSSEIPLKEKATNEKFTFLKSKLLNKAKSPKSDTFITLRQYLQKPNRSEDPLEYWKVIHM